MTDMSIHEMELTTSDKKAKQFISDLRDGDDIFNIKPIEDGNICMIRVKPEHIGDNISNSLREQLDGLKGPETDGFFITESENEMCKTVFKDGEISYRPGYVVFEGDGVFVTEQKLYDNAWRLATGTYLTESMTEWEVLSCLENETPLPVAELFEHFPEPVIYDEIHTMVQAFMHSFEEKKNTQNIPSSLLEENNNDNDNILTYDRKR